MQTAVRKHSPHISQTKLFLTLIVVFFAWSIWQGLHAGCLDIVPFLNKAGLDTRARIQYEVAGTRMGPHQLNEAMLRFYVFDRAFREGFSNDRRFAKAVKSHFGTENLIRIREQLVKSVGIDPNVYFERFGLDSSHPGSLQKELAQVVLQFESQATDGDRDLLAQLRVHAKNKTFADATPAQREFVKMMITHLKNRALNSLLGRETERDSYRGSYADEELGHLASISLQQALLTPASSVLVAAQPTPNPIVPKPAPVVSRPAPNTTPPPRIRPEPAVTPEIPRVVKTPADLDAAIAQVFISDDSSPRPQPQPRTRPNASREEIEADNRANGSTGSAMGLSELFALMRSTVSDRPAAATAQPLVTASSADPVQSPGWFKRLAMAGIILVTLQIRPVSESSDNAVPHREETAAATFLDQLSVSSNR